MKYDVFISFRGIDTRRTFVSHLLLSLFKEQFTTFKQEEEIPWNQPASSQVLDAIENSKIAIVVISKNYTSSVSCLDELAKIIEWDENSSFLMIPVLYEVDPSYVLGQADNLGPNLADGDDNLEKVKRWRNALAKSIEIYQEIYSYWEDRDSYAFIIDRVMIHVSKRLRPPLPKSEDCKEDSVDSTLSSKESKPMGFVTKGIGFVKAALVTIAERFMDKEKPVLVKTRPSRSSLYVHKDTYVTGDEPSQLGLSSDFSSLVGMDRQMQEVDTLLRGLDPKDGVGEIGISGEKRVGKTTLARCVYEKISPQFQDHYYFVSDDHTSNHRCPPDLLDSTCLLYDITRSALETMLKPERFDETMIAKISSRDNVRERERVDEAVIAKLGHRKVLLIVDGRLYHSGQVEHIRKSARWFGPGSRLIFVTHNKDLLVKCGVQRIYEVETLRYDEALQLFAQYAFKQEHVPREYHRVSVRAVLITGRIPLALRVFGSFLRGKTINEWEFELCRLEALQDNFVAKVSSYIVNAFS